MTTRSRAGQLVSDLPFPDISLPDISLPEISLADLSGRVSQLRLPEMDVAELGDRLRELGDLPVVGSVKGSVGQARRSPLARVVLALAVAGAAFGALAAFRRLRGRATPPDHVAA